MEKMEIPFEMADEKKGGWMGFLLGFLAHFFFEDPTYLGYFCLNKIFM